MSYRERKEYQLSYTKGGDNMIITLIDMHKLSKLIQLTSPLRKKGKWKDSFTVHDEEIVEKILHEYGNYWGNIVRKYLPHYNPQQHKINVQSIYVSPEIRDIILDILPPGFVFFKYSPSVVERNMCIIDDSTILIEKRDDV